MFTARQYSMRHLISILAAALAYVGSAISDQGSDTYRTTCVACHDHGVMAAPNPKTAEDWVDRRKKGLDVLIGNAINGINQMPPKGGNPALSDATIRSAVEYMLALADGSESSKQESKAASPRPPASESKQAGATTVTAARAAAPKRTAKVNAFNRLMKPPSQRNLPPMRDGIHDPDNSDTAALQHPREAFESLPKSNSGNRVDWVAALAKGEVAPRFDLEDPEKQPIVLDLNIVREVKGSMPDVVYPHKQHTEWLDCSNCHPSIFLPKKGANKISMASILLGEKCGVCHGKVAFPVSECRKCHSKNKPKVQGK